MSQSSSSWDSLNKPQSIVDYVNGTVIAHTHQISDIIGLQSDLDSKFDNSNLAPTDTDFSSIPDFAIIDLAFLKKYYYTSSQVDAIVSNIESGSGSIIGSSQVDVSTGIDLDFVNYIEKVFVASSSINSTKTWSVSNASNALKFQFIFSVSGSYDQQLPTNFVMADSQFDITTHIWTPPVSGTYVADAVSDGSNWYLNIKQFL